MQPHKPLLLVVAFFAMLLPLAGNYAIHHPDEQFYTAGAMEMLRSGDWATPRDEHGAPRFQKPVLAYWLVAASYGLLGVSPLASRLPFLLVGCAVLALSYATARVIGGDRRVATFALLVLLSQPQFVLASLRSMTDIVLAGGVLLSGFGFLAVIGGERSRSGLFLAYAGAGVGFLAKGMPALLFVAFVFAFVLLDRRRPASLKSLIEPASMSVVALSVAAWFAVAWARHGPGVVQGFWTDQIEHRLTAASLQPLWLAPALTLFYVVAFLPWSAAALALFVADPGARRAGDRRLRSTRLFLLSWALLLAVVFAWAREPEEHYVLPAIPFLAVLLGDVLGKADAERAGRVLRASFAATLAVVLSAALLMAWALVQIGAPPGATAALFCLTAAVAGLGYAALARLWIEPATAQALVILLVFPLLLAAMAPIALPDPGEQLARRLEEQGLLDGAGLLFVGNLGLAGKVRVATGGRGRLDRVEALGGGAPSGYRAIVVPGRDAAVLADDGYVLGPGSRGYAKLDVVGLFAAILRGRLGEFLARHRNEYLIAVRRPAAAGL